MSRFGDDDMLRPIIERNIADPRRCVYVFANVRIPQNRRVGCIYGSIAIEQMVTPYRVALLLLRLRFVYSSITKINCYMTRASLTLSYWLVIATLRYGMSELCWVVQKFQQGRTISACYSSKSNALIDICCAAERIWMMRKCKGMYFVCVNKLNKF